MSTPAPSASPPPTSSPNSRATLAAFLRALPESDLRAKLERLSPAMLAEAREALRETREAEARAAEPLLDFVPRVSPHLVRPDHLAPVADLFERIRRGERVRACVSVPAQHGKTELVLHGLAWLLRGLPRDTFAYATYSDTQAGSKSLGARTYARAAGVPLSTERANLGEWRTTSGGGALFMGVGGPLTGQGITGAIVDDPYKNRVEAESPLMRQRVRDWFTSVVMTRFQEGGSIVVVHTRWHDDDLIGTLAKGECGPFEIVNLPFLANDRGEPDDHGEVVLNPYRVLPGGKVFGWTIEGAREQLRNVGPYDAASIYQGTPRPKGGQVFHEPTRFDVLDLAGARIVLAVDPAGSDDTKANHTVAVALAVRGYGDAMTADLAGLLRFQLRPEGAAPRLLGFQRRFGAMLRIEGSRDGKEQVRCLKLLARDLSIETIPAIGDKFLRAQPAAAAWNAEPSRLRVPSRASVIGATEEELAEFLRVLARFTGLGDREDDDVDALSHAWNRAAAPSLAPASSRPSLVGTPSPNSW